MISGRRSHHARVGAPAVRAHRQSCRRQAMRRAGRLFRCCRAPADRTLRSATYWRQGKAARTEPACKCTALQHRRSRPTESPWPGRTHSRGKSRSFLYAWATIGDSPTKSFTFARIVGNRGAFLRSAARILWILMASGSIGPSGLTLELHASPLRQPSPSRSISTKPTSMMMPRSSPGKRLLANELGVGCTLASRLRIEGDEPVETVEEIRQVHRGAPKQR